MKHFLTLLLILLAVAVHLQIEAQTHIVPDDYATIQEAIDQSDPNDTILLKNGIYTENITITKSLVITSLYLQTNNDSDILNTVIDGDTSGSVVTVKDVPAGEISFIGMTVRNGTGTLADPLDEGLGGEYLHGGGFFIKDAGTIYFKNMLVTENHIPTLNNSAGGIFCRNTDLNINNSTITENSVKGFSFLGEGAGIYVLDGHTVISNSEITHNISSMNYGKGGGIFAVNSTLKLSNSIINENENIDGGAIYTEDTNTEITDCEINNNYAESTGAILAINYPSDSSTVLIENCEITNNYANNTGGTVAISQITAEIRTCLISGNEGGGNGGAISASSSQLSVYDCEILNNTSSSGIGGDAAGMLIYRSTVYMNNVDVSGNECLPDNNFNMGGGIKCYDSDITMENVVVSDNKADEGGGIYSMKSTLTIRKSRINGNTADSGGALWSYGGHIYFISSTITGNNAGMGSGIYSLEDTLVLANSILWNESGDELFSRLDHDTTYFFSAYSNIRGLESNFANGGIISTNWLDGNTDFEPGFADAENGDYELDPSSELIDKGTDSFAFDTLVLIDYSPDEYWGTAPDMGAYEYSGTVSVSEYTASEIKVFPNPFSDFITIESQHNITRLELFDISGKRVFVVENRNTAGIGNLKKGMYFLRVYSEEKLIISKKLMKY